MTSWLVPVSLDEPLRPLDVEAGALLVVLVAGAVVGEVPLRDAGTISPEAQRRAIETAVGDAVWRARLRATFTRAARAPAVEPPEHPLSVVVCGPEGPGPRDADAELIAFTESGTVPDAGWLAGLDEAFRDPLRMAVKGYVPPPRGEPLRAQAIEPAVYDCFSRLPPPTRGGNFILRREVLGEVEAPDGSWTDEAAESKLYDQIFAAGYRVAFDPSRIAWREPVTFEAPALQSREPATTGANPSEPPPPSVVRDDDPELTVTIASYNRRESLARVLEALGGQSYPRERFDVVVVLDGSTDGSAEHMRLLDLPYRLELVEQENRGLAASRNRGAREAGAPVVVFLDDDVLPEPEFLAEHAAAHRDLSGRAVALGSYPPARRSYELHEIPSRHWWEDYFRRRSEPDHQWCYMDFCDGNVSFPRELVAETGGWNEEFVRETVRRQDWEYGIRLLKQGVRFVDRAAARGWHHFEVSFEKSLRNRRVEGSADVVLGEKHPEVRGHLPLARIMATAAERGYVWGLVELAYARPSIVEGLLRGAGVSAEVLERTRRPRPWSALAGRLATVSYVLGVRDRLKTREELQQFMTDVPVARATVALDGTGPIQLAPAVGQIELELEWAGVPLAHVQALEPEKQWDWDIVTERVVREALEPFRRVSGDGAPSA